MKIQVLGMHNISVLYRLSDNQVPIPAEHLWCDFKYRPWAKNSSPNTNDLYIHYMDKGTGTPPSLEEENALINCGNKEIHVLKNCISTSVATFLKCMKLLYPYVQVIGVWWWVFFLMMCLAVQTVAIKLEAHNSLEYHYILKH